MLSFIAFFSLEMALLSDVYTSHGHILQYMFANSSVTRRNSVAMIADKIVGYHRKRMVPTFYYLAYTNLNLSSIFYRNGLISTDKAIAGSGSLSKVDVDSRLYKSRWMVLQVASRWSDPEWIPLFLHYLDYLGDNGQKEQLDNIAKYDTYVSVKGLINIGKPSIPACIGELAGGLQIEDMKESEQRRRMKLLVYVLYSILGRKDAESVLYAEYQRLNNVNKKHANNLKIAIDYLKSNELFKGHDVAPVLH